MKKKPVSIECFESFILFNWEGGPEICLDLKTLRECCPCAFCSGETDVLGNVYAGNKKQLSKEGFVLKGYSFVGLYAVRFIWGDGHSDGLFSFDLIKKIFLAKNEN